MNLTQSSCSIHYASLDTKRIRKPEFTVMSFLSHRHFKHLFCEFSTAVIMNRIFVFASSFPLKGKKYCKRFRETAHTMTPRMAKHKFTSTKFFLLSSHSLKRGVHYIKNKD